jgi:putative peptidoglycan lipid II flippase
LNRPAGLPGRAACLAQVVMAGISGLAGIVGVGAAAPAAAQTGPGSVPARSLVLTAQTAWIPSATNGDFRIGVLVAAASQPGARLAVTVYQRLSSRSDFNETLAGRLHTGVRHAFKAEPLSSLATDSSGSYTLDVPVNTSPAQAGQDSLRVLSPGVYPVEVRLIDPNGLSLGRLVTHLLYTGDSPASQPRLDVAWVIPVQAPPALTPDGRLDRLPAAGAQSLADLAGALVQFADVPVTLAPTPQTLESLLSTDAGASGRATAAAFGQVAARTNAQVVDRPYVAVNLAAMTASGLDAELSAQLRRAGETLSAPLGVRPDLRTWVESGQLDRASADGLIDRGVDRLVVSDNALTPLPADLRNTTVAQPFTLQGRGDRRVSAAAADPGLAAHFIAGGDQVLAAHQLLADLAMIQEERPANRRGVAMVPPNGWRPDAGFLREVLGGLAASPWLAPVTVDRLFADVPEVSEHGTPLQRSVTSTPPAAPLPNAVAIKAARHRLDAFSTMLPSDSTLYPEIERPLLLSESSDLRERDRATELALVARLIDQQTRLIRLPANTSITLTARQGRFPVTIISSAPYQPKVQIRLSSHQKLVFLPIEEPGAACQVAGSVETCTLDLRTQNTTLKVPVVARTAGVFSLTINLTTPDGGLTLASSDYAVRSTAASGVGIFLSIGAALLLAAWWARDLRHGRRARGLVPAAGGVGGGDDPTAGGDNWLIGDLPPRPPPPTGAAPVSAAPERVSTVVTAPPPPAPTRADPEPASAGDAGRPVDRSSTAGTPLPASFSRNTLVMASGTLLSRLTGFARVLALVYAFRLTRLADIYNLANTAPNIIYDLVLGGVLSATLVPVFVDWFGRDEEDGWRAVSAVVTAITLTLAVLSVLFWLLAPFIIRLYLVLDHSPGGADQRALGTTLLRLFAPQLFFLGGIALTTALLNARRQFFVPAYSPVVNNLVTIGAIVAARMVAGSLELSAFRRDTAAVLILGLGTTSGYLIQLVTQLPALIRGGCRLRPVWDLHHPAVRTVLRLSLWTFGSVIANQVAFNLVLILAARKAGDVTAFQTAFQFFQLPYAIFAVSIASVITPDLSDRWARADVAGFRRQLASGLRLTLAVIVPGAVGYLLVARPAIALFVRHGGVGGSAAHLIGTIVALFALGLPGFSAYLLLMRAYQAMQDTRSMFWLYAIENGLTIVLAVALYPLFGVGGLALGWVGAYSLGSIAAFAHLRGRTGGLEGRATAAACVRIGLASAAMAAVVAVVLHVGGATAGQTAPRVIAAVVGGAFVYFFAGRALGLTELRTLGNLRKQAR